MNRVFLLFITTIALSGSHALADDLATTYFFPAKGNESAVTLNYQTGEKNQVVEAFAGAKPADCPKSAFWMKDNYSLVHCDSGLVYAIKQYTGPKKELLGAFSLLPEKPKPPGTDDPGPSIQKDLQN